MQSERAAGSEGAVYVSILPSLNGRGSEGRVPAPAPTPTLTIPHEGGGKSGEGGEEGTSEILRQIRVKIERVKFYPFLAKRRGLEGTPKVEFQTEQDGSLKFVSLKETSGHEELDEAALKTIRQATPLPFYPEPISLAISYGLSSNP